MCLQHISVSHIHSPCTDLNEPWPLQELQQKLQDLHKMMPEYRAGVKRFGVNRRETLRALQQQWNSVAHDNAGMRVVPYGNFKMHEKLPRSSDNKTVALTNLPHGARLVFISHNWMRGDEEQCKRNGHVWEGGAHPDDEKATKHRLVCRSVEELARKKGWKLDEVYVWLDFCGIEQDDTVKKMAGVEIP